MIALVGTLAPRVFASKDLNYRAFSTTFDGEEYETVLADLKADPYMSRYTESYKAEFHQKIVNPYKIYSIDMETFMNTPADRLRDVIAQKPYSWVLPTLNRNHYLMTSEEGKWRMLYYSEKEQAEKPDSLIDFDNPAWASLPLDFGKTVIYPIKITDDGFSNYLYLSDGNKQYMILCSARPDLIPLKNHEAYSVDEIKSMLREVFPPQHGDGFLNGGEILSEDSARYGWIVAIAAAAVLAVGGMVLYRVIKKRSE